MSKARLLKNYVYYKKFTNIINAFKLFCEI